MMANWRRWIKLYIEILDDPKMGKMSDWMWRRTIELFLLAGENGNDGELQPVGDLAWRLRLEESKLLAALESLSQAGVTELLPNGIWKIRNFTKRQDADNPTERKQAERLRERKFGHDPTSGNVTKGDETVTKRDTDKKGLEEIRKEEDESRGEEKGPAAASFPERLSNVQLFCKITNMSYIPSGSMPAVMTALDALKQKYKDDPGLIAFLSPFWESWKGRRTKDGRKFSELNCAWLTDWAATGSIPPERANGNGNTNGNGYEKAMQAIQEAMNGIEEDHPV